MANIIGTEGPDNPLTGTAAADSIFGLGGDDGIVSGAGNDTIDAGSGYDFLQLWPDYPSSGARIDMAAGTVTPIMGGSEIDLFSSVEMIVATSFDDIYDASQFGLSPGARNIGNFGFGNQIMTLRGNDTVTGNGSTLLVLRSSGDTTPISVNLREGWARSEYLGNKTILGGINGVEASRFADSIVMGDPANNAFENYRASNGNDTLDGGAGYDRAEYHRIEISSGGLRIDLGAGTVAGKADGSIDTLRNVEAIRGSRLGDVFDARQYSLTSANQGGGFSRFVPLLNHFDGDGGNDIIQGNGYTAARYTNATAGVKVDLNAGTASSLAPNDEANVGIDTLSGVHGVYGGSYNDLMIGGNPGNDQLEIFRGLGGNDTLDGGRGWDLAQMTNGVNWMEYDGRILFVLDASGDRIYTEGVTIKLAAGTASDNGALGNDTLRGIEAVSGSVNDDTFDARGFGSSSVNSGAFGDLNEFQGDYGNDTIIGNGATRISFSGAEASVTVDFTKGQSSSSQYLIDGNDAALIGIDNFSGVNAVRGSYFADTFIGSSAREVYFGSGGNDIIRGGGGADLAILQGNRSQYAISTRFDSEGQTIISIVDQVAGRDDRDTLYDVTRVQFADQTVAYDVGVDDTAAEAYRIYKAAFNRTPDLPGLGYWIQEMDNGAALRDVAGGFLQSREFIQKNGPNLSDADFINAMYFNVLGRGADQGGYDYWLAEISNGLSRADILSFFSESAENISNVAGQIANGIVYEPLQEYQTAGLYLV